MNEEQPENIDVDKNITVENNLNVLVQREDEKDILLVLTMLVLLSRSVDFFGSEDDIMDGIIEVDDVLVRVDIIGEDDVIIDDDEERKETSMLFINKSFSFLTGIISDLTTGIINDDIQGVSLNA